MTTNKTYQIVGGELGEYPNEKYRQFFEKFAEINSLAIGEWKVVHLIAYFCQSYQNKYNISYQFKFNSPTPNKSFEVFQIKRLGMLLSSNPSIIKEYIDWVFQNKVIRGKRRFTSISFLTREEIVQEYKMNVLFNGKNDLNVDRSTVLPEKYRRSFQELGITVQTYGDLAFISQMEQTTELSQAFEIIKSQGFEMETLKRIV